MDNRSLILLSFWTTIGFILLSLAAIGIYFFGKVFIKYRTEVEEYRKYTTEFDLETEKNQKNQEPHHTPAPIRSESIFSINNQ